MEKATIELINHRIEGLGRAIEFKSKKIVEIEKLRDENLELLYKDMSELVQQRCSLLKDIKNAMH